MERLLADYTVFVLFVIKLSVVGRGEVYARKFPDHTHLHKENHGMPLISLNIW